jgi:AhpD family alkylhydroperoxidase
MSTIDILGQKEKELIALAVSIAAGCQPCTAHHVKVANEVGATETEISAAIENALNVRISATKIMAEIAYANQSDKCVVEPQIGSLQQLINEVISIGASLACNSVNGLEYHLQRAKITGASDRQIQTALGIARAIKKEAEEKSEAVVEGSGKPAKLQTDESCGNGCGCQNTDNSQMSETTEGVAFEARAKKETEPQSCGCG